MRGKMDLIIFGTGRIYQKYKDRFAEHNVLALADNAAEKQNELIDGRIVIAPDDLVRYQYDYIIVLVQAYGDIYRQLLGMGINAEKIVTINPEGMFGEFRKIKGDIYNTSADILLVSHEMNMRGAPLMLYEAAKIMKQEGMEVAVAAAEDGNLKQYYYNLGIPVFEFDDFVFSYKEIKNIFGKYKIVFVNTLALSDLVCQLEGNVRNIVWWLHEEWSAYDRLKPNRNVELGCNGIKVYGVGRRAIESFGDYYGHEILIRNLQWGIEEKASADGKSNSKMIFGVIGEVCDIKGQDLLLDVMDKNFQEILSFVEFWIIGRIRAEDRKKFEMYSSVKVFGEIDHKELMDLYKEMDVVLSTSRNDTMPVVLVEGLMKKKVVMTSTGTGVSDYITSHYNGIVYESEDILGLSREILWVVNNRMKLDAIRNRGYELYREIFSIESFKRHLLEIVRQFE